MTNPDTASSVVVFTIGHSNLPIEKFIGLLKANGIRTLVDVRSSPYSQYAHQFNRETLERSLFEAGISYKYAGDRLGGRPSDPSLYKSGVIPEGKIDYLILVDYQAVMKRDWFIAGVDELSALAQKEASAVMCSEEKPEKCHRHHLVGKALVDRGVVVKHILADGGLLDFAGIAFQPSLF